MGKLCSMTAQPKLCPSMSKLCSKQFNAVKTCLKRGQTQPKDFPMLSKLSRSPKPTQTLPTCPNLPKDCLHSVQWLPKLCLKYTQSSPMMPKLCSKTFKSLPKLDKRLPKATQFLPKAAQCPAQRLSKLCSMTAQWCPNYAESCPKTYQTLLKDCRNSDFYVW